MTRLPSARVRAFCAARHLWNIYWPVLVLVVVCTVGFLIMLPHPLPF